MRPLDKRAIVRDLKIGSIGVMRRIQLRIKPTPTVPAYNPDPTIDTQQNSNPNNDTLLIISGVFTVTKTSQEQAEAGAIEKERGVVWFHPVFLNKVQQAYKFYIGGTGKTWVQTSIPTLDTTRGMLKVSVEASS